MVREKRMSGGGEESNDSGEGNKLSMVEGGMMTVTEAVKHTTLSRAQLYVKMAAGEIPFVLWGHRRLIPRNALNKLMAARLVGE